MMRVRTFRRQALLSLLLSSAACVDPDAPYLQHLDTDPPTLVRSTPSFVPPGETLPASDAISLVFSEPMDPLSLRGGLTLIEDATNTDVPLTVFVEPEDPNSPPIQVRGEVEFLVQLRPIEGTLKTATAYRLVLGAALTDTEGNPFPEPLTFEFRTDP